jgi:hypothetical protein
VLVLQYEQCRDDAARQFRRTCAFLGIDGDFVPSNLERPRYPTRAEKVALPAAVAAALCDIYRDDVALLAQLAPDLDLDRWSLGVSR